MKAIHQIIEEILTSNDEYTKALLVSVVAHYGQKDKAGEPYIRHPLYVSEAFAGSPQERAAALLHDVVEDTLFDLEMLSELGFSDFVLEVVSDLTKDPTITYEQNILRVLRSKHALTAKIKIEDLKHNLSLTRLKNRFSLGERDMKRLRAYVDALNLLGYRG